MAAWPLLRTSLCRQESHDLILLDRATSDLCQCKANVVCKSFNCVTVSQRYQMLLGRRGLCSPVVASESPPLSPDAQSSACPLLLLQAHQEVLTCQTEVSRAGAR